MNSALDARLERIADGTATSDDLMWLAERYVGRLVVAEQLVRACDVRAKRNGLFRQLRREHYAHFQIRPAAEAIATDILRYQTTAWRHDRRWPTSPYPDGSLKAAQWELLSLGTHMPGWRRVFDILNDG